MANSALGQTGFGAGAVATANVADDAITEPKVAPGAGLKLATEQASTSGTDIDFTSIPAGVKRITITLRGVSPNATGAGVRVQLGDSGGLETSGYLGNYGFLDAGTPAITALSSGFQVSGPNAASDTYNGAFTLTRTNDTHSWVCTGLLALTSATVAIMWCAGSYTLSAELDRIRVNWSNGTNTFDAGSINIAYE